MKLLAGSQRVVRRGVCWFLLPLVSVVADGGATNDSVRIPQLRGVAVAQAYVRLHQAGLRVSIPAGFEFDALISSEPAVERVSPHPGKSVRPGSIVSLTVGCLGCGAGSPGVPLHLPVYRVPDFVGDRASVPERWIRPKILYLTEHFGRLRAGSARRLDENYRIVRQRPVPGAKLKLGIGHRISATSGSFLPTPLTLWSSQER